MCCTECTQRNGSGWGEVFGRNFDDGQTSISPVVAGVIGALVTLAVAIVVVAGSGVSDGIDGG